MKTVAVIPARGGSRGIPNKNIRLLDNRPLVYYSIKNAKESKYIDEVIVTTDSEEIVIIAKQMGVRVIMRPLDLCADDITLDAVIYDAIKDVICSYVVTMQPTSPALRVSTLDSAIEYTTQEGVDTLISVVNRPHLAWREESRKKVPAYSERLNRQYLPPYYIETGAFLIARREIITPSSRIGKNVDVFEIPEQEALDIDTFEDLKYAQTIFNQQKVAIYVNGNNIRGMGHIYRSLEIADEFYCKPYIFYDINQTDIRLFGKTTHKLNGVNGIGDLLNICEKEQFDIFINDILDTSIDYMIALKNVLPNAKIINFEDDGEGIYKADLVFNALYEGEALRQVKYGDQYYISSKLFMFYEPITIRKHVEHVFISFGGADPQNYTDRLLNMIEKEKYAKIKFTVVLGRAKKNVKELMEYNQYKNINVLYDVYNMPELMSQCDIGITSRGRTSYELTMLGIPSVVMSQNAREEKHGFIRNENGFTYLGTNPSDYIIESNVDMFLHLSEKDRKKYQEILLSHDLRHGRKRVMDLINSL